ncbi:winged helix-turn-helix domain-containing protein [Archaeoglobus veneficus]|uniref:Transcriptional regulator protein-like protein n=1 Tax=Archaeoglobus veneficus (strain DSM 11195 / SNP6) TaxID=693661 RepID=F2KMH8_ARCVS|nr:winged helix-turn-helix domain-containing protein [Archaeoglobus veneficus]AEA47175.1 transcriptional regulator protein-like protein [Archaeoglobus veneficus SNP6]
MRRTRLDIIMDILSLTLNGGANKTKIVYGANLNFKIAGQYLEFMVDAGLIVERIDNGKILYVATEKGVNTLAKFRELISEASI